MKRGLIKKEQKNRGDIVIKSKKVGPLKSELVIIIKNLLEKSSKEDEKTYFFPTTTTGFR